MIKKLICLALTLASVSSFAAGMSVYVVPEILHDNLSDDADDDYRGLQPRITLGVSGFAREYFYLAGEIFLSPLKDYTLSASAPIALIKPKWSYGASLNPGLLLDDYVKAFLRFGVIQTDFEDVSSTTGFMLGIGIDVSLAAGWDIRAEYIRTKYRSSGDVGSIVNNQFGLGLVIGFNLSGVNC